MDIKFLYNKMSKLPHRNTIKNTKDFILDRNISYKQRSLIKPSGLWYQIDDCLFKWPELYWGNVIHGIKLKNNIINKPKGLISINNTEDFLKFHKKYKRLLKFKDGFAYDIKWKKVSEDYGGFEIKNYNKIKDFLRKEKNYIINYTWFFTFDFSSGCIWDLTLIKDIYYYKTLSKKYIDDIYGY